RIGAARKWAHRQLDLVGWNTRTVVLEMDSESVLTRPLRDDLNPPSGGRELHRVRKKVEPDLVQCAAIRHQLRQGLGDVDHKRDLLLAEPHLDDAKRLLDRSGDNYRFILQIMPPGLDPRKIEEIIDEREE